MREVRSLGSGRELSACRFGEWAAGESFEHDVDHTDMDQGFAGFRPVFIVLAQPAAVVDPRDRAFHHPATRQDREAFGLVGAFHDLQFPVTGLFRPSDEFPGVAAIGPDELQSRKSFAAFLQDQLGSVTVLNAGDVNDNEQQQSQGVHQQMTLAAVDLLACVVTS